MGCRHSRPVSVAVDVVERIHRTTSVAVVGPSRSRLAEFDETERLHGCGHVFVLHCSIKQLAADAILIPDS